MPEYGVKQYGASEDYGVRPDYGVGQGDSGPFVSALTSTLTSSAASFVAGGAGVTLTFTARDAANNLIEGYTPVPQSGVV
jgi:hypothetical protein